MIDPSPATGIATRPAAAPGRLARWWSAPLWLHVVALALVLAAGLALSGPRVAFTSDEGVAVVQAQMLRDGQGWLYHPPLTQLDPQGQARPFVRGDLGTRGLAPYAKHPLYPVVLAGLDLVGGTWAMVVGGLAATLVAAALAALLACQLDPRLDRVVLWLVGAASPLLFDGYLVLAHTLAAAAVAAAGLAVLFALRRRVTLTSRALAGVGMAVAVMVAGMLRTEALFIGPAMAVALVAVAIARRIPARRALILAAGAGAASVAAWSSDRIWSHAILGTSLPVPGNVAPASWLAGRWDALHTTWFQASYGAGRTPDLLLGLGALALAVAALLLHARKPRLPFLYAALVVAAVAYLSRLLVGPAALVPGLLLAFPAGGFLLLASGRRVVEGRSPLLLAGTTAAATGAILVTEYAIGGGVEWGGRYFAVVLPLALPVLVFAAEPVIRRHGAEVTRAVVATLVLVSVCATFLALGTLRSGHRDTAAVLDGIRTEAGVAGTRGGLARPVVLSTNRLLPQIDWRDFDRYDWVVPDPQYLTRYGDRLAAAGVDRVVLVSDDQGADLAHLPGWRVVHQTQGLALQVSVLERST